MKSADKMAKTVRYFLSALALVLTACDSTQPLAPSGVAALPQSAATATVPASPNVLALEAAQAGTLAQPALIDFYSDDCRSCRVARPAVGQLDVQFVGRVKFIYLDVDLPESQPYMTRYDVRGLPTIALLDRRGRLVESFAGWPGNAAMGAKLEELVARP
jgi:thioredoxin-like negative regulator of GroEL